MKLSIKKLIGIWSNCFFNPLFALFTLVFLSLSGLSASCYVTSNAVICNSTVDNIVYNDPSLDIPNRDYLNATSIDNIGNGTWSINRANIQEGGIHASSQSTINIGGGSNIRQSSTNNYGYGVLADTDSSISIGSGSNISASSYYGGYGGGDLYGVYVRSGSNISIGSGSIINAYGQSHAYGVYADYDSNINIGANSNITASINVNRPSGFAYGIYARYSNVSVGDNVNIYTTSPDGTTAISAYSSNVYLGNGITVHGTIGGSFYANISIGDNMTVHGAISGSSNANISNRGTLYIMGDIHSSIDSYVKLYFTGNSYLNGSTSHDYYYYNGFIDLTFDGPASLWRLTGNSSLTDLNLLNNAKVDLTRGGESLTSVSPTVLTVDNLYGEGVFDIRVDIANDLNDRIRVINSSSGNHQVHFYDKTSGGYDGSSALLVIAQNSPYADYYLANYYGTIDLGGYEYTLKKATTNDNWYIMPTSAAPISPNCIVSGGGVICYNTVNKDIYANAALDIPNRNYLNIMANGTNAVALNNNNNGSWNINKLFIDTNYEYAVWAKSSEITAGNNSIINAAIYDFSKDSNNLTHTSTDTQTAIYATNANISFGGNSYINGTIVLDGLSTLSMGQNTSINSTRLNIDEQENYNGDKYTSITSISDRNAINSENGASTITIGDNSHISGTVALGSNSLFILGDNSSISNINLEYYQYENGTLEEIDKDYSDVLYMESNSTVIIGDNANLSGSIYGESDDGRVSLAIGDNAYIKSNHNIIHMYSGNVTIGENFTASNLQIEENVYPDRYELSVYTYYDAIVAYNSNVYIGNNSNIEGGIEFFGDYYGAIGDKYSFVIGDNVNISSYYYYYYNEYSFYDNYTNIESDFNNQAIIADIDNSDLIMGDNVDIIGRIRLYGSHYSNFTIGDNLTLRSGSYNEYYDHDNGDFNIENDLTSNAIDIYAENSNVIIGNNADITSGIKFAGLESNFTIGDNLTVNALEYTSERYNNETYTQINFGRAFMADGENITVSIGDNAYINGTVVLYGVNSIFAIGDNLTINAYEYEKNEDEHGNVSESYDFVQALYVSGYDNSTLNIGDNAQINGIVYVESSLVNTGNNTVINAGEENAIEAIYYGTFLNAPGSTLHITGNILSSYYSNINLSFED
ncbi:MAG: hypothetical protein LBS39_04000, partial [Campylobacteraceae bacterium]|nr:hypothetical protein [Campylobacteraceae bacterium]